MCHPDFKGLTFLSWSPAIYQWRRSSLAGVDFVPAKIGDGRTVVSTAGNIWYVSLLALKFIDRPWHLPATTLAFIVIFNEATANSNPISTLIISSGVLSFATNSVSTLIIFWRLWCVIYNLLSLFIFAIIYILRTYRKFVRKNFGLLHRPSLVHNILVLLLESGIVYLVLQVSMWMVISALRYWFSVKVVYIVLPFVAVPVKGSTLDNVDVAFTDIFLALSVRLLYFMSNVCN